MKKLMIVLVLIMIASMTCGKRESEGKSKAEVKEDKVGEIVGRWKEVDGDQTLEFSRDGIVTLIEKGGTRLGGDYEFINENEIKMNFPLFGIVVAKLSSSRNEFTLTNPFGKIERYQRVDKKERIWVESERGREKQPPVLEPRKEAPILKITFSQGVFRIGNFLVVLSSIEREASRTNLKFAITRLGKTGAKIKPLAITLTDDHENNYYGTLDLIPYNGFPFPLLPEGFTYVKTASIMIPKPAPIETVQLENTKKIPLKKLKTLKPPFKADFKEAFLQLGETTQVGKFLFFSIDSIVPDLYTWAIEATIENKDYNPLRGKIQCTVQLVDGRILAPEAPEVETISGLSKQKTQIKLDSLRGETTPNPRLLLVFYQSLFRQEQVLKLLPISKENLPPRVGQGTDEEVFIEAYQRNGGQERIGNPAGLPYWYAGKTSPKDEFDVLVQEFPNSTIFWDKQNNASKAYLLHGAVLKKYQEPEIYRNLGPPIDDLRSWESSFGTKGIYGTFENGMITSRAGQTLIVMGKIYKKWKEENFIKGPLGFPVSKEREVVSGARGSDTTGWVQRFEGGYIYCVTKGKKMGQDFAIHGAIAKVYSQTGAEASWLGFPVTEVYKSLGSKPADQAEFEGGYIGSRDGRKWEVFPYETGQIAFVSNRDGNKEIYVMDADGQNQVNLTNHPADDWDPAWSPDGKKLAFVSNRDGNPEIYVMDAKGANLIRLTNNNVDDLNPAWFPDGLKLAFASLSNERFYDERLFGIFTMNTDGTNRSLLWHPMRGALLKGHGSEPVVSPDGKEILLVARFASLLGSQADLYLIKSDGSKERFLYKNTRSPSSSPDGNKIAFQKEEGIMLIDAQKGESWLTKFGQDPSFSPDGERIVFSHQGEIYIVDVTGSLGRKVTREIKGQNWNPCWTEIKPEGETKDVFAKEVIPLKKTTPAEETAPTIAKEISEAGIPGKYIPEKIDAQGNSLSREPVIMNFQKDGSIVGSYAGRWIVLGEDIKFLERSQEVGKGKLLAGAIANWQVEDVPYWQAEKILRKREAKILRKVSEWTIVWSDYFSPENPSFTLKLQKDGTFSMLGLLEGKWKIENGAVQIYRGEKKTDFSDGRIEGNNIVFKFKDGLVRLTKQD